MQMLGRAVVVATGTLMLAGAAGAQTEPAAPRAQAVAKAPAGQPALQPVAAEPDPLTPAEANGPPPVAPGAPPAVAAAAPIVAPSDPVVLEIRNRLAATRGREAAADAADRAALVDFYQGASARALWTASEGFTARAKLAMAEIRRADDWGLKASAFDLPSESTGVATAEARADAEIKVGLAILKYARHARGGRLDPPSITKLLDRKPTVYDPKTLIQAIALAEAPDAYLRGLHPKLAQFRNLQKALVAARGTANQKPQPAEAAVPRVEIPSGPRIKPGEKHPHVVLVRMRLGLTAQSGNEAVYDEAMVTAVREHQRQNGQQPTGILSNDTRRSLSGGSRVAAAPRDTSDTVQRIVVNMERLRWMPDDLGDLHVWNNIPEQMTSVVKAGKVVLHERIVVGKPDTPTPNFSADMQFVIFQPEWGVPGGIKNNELAPLLRRASSEGGGWFGDSSRTPASVLARFGLRVSQGNQILNPDNINWASVDINRFNFVQPAGAKNVLGVVKFRFPNKHDVYMHDTPEKHLFGGGLRAFSHGCMRVQNPVRLAEVLLEHDKGWSADYVRGMVPRGGEVKLTKVIPVHNVYFTAMADADGKLRFAGDLYGVDSRMASALEGRNVAIASRGEPVEGNAEAAATSAPRERSERQVRQKRQSGPSSGSSGFNPFAGLFGN